MQALESSRGSRLIGLAAAIVLLLAFMLQAAPDVFGQGLKDDADDGEQPYEEAGIVDFHEYRSPNWGWGVEWERGWDLDTWYEPPVTTDEDSRHDQLHLAWSGDDGAYAYVTIQGAPADEDEPADEIEHWTDPAYIEDAWEATFEVTPILTYDDEDSAQVVYSIVDTSDDDAQHYTMFETLVVNGDWVYISFTTNADSLEAAFAATTSGITLDGDSILTGVAWDELEDAIADAA